MIPESTTTGFPTETDVLVIGGGFFGCAVAAFEAERGARVALVERAEKLLTRASYANQARVHGGYHYPRSFRTAYRSRVNLPAFCRDFEGSVRTDFTNVYAIARGTSKTSRRQYKRFCEAIGAPLEPAPPPITGLFSRHLIEAVFVTEEFVFDALALRRFFEGRLVDLGVAVVTGSSVERVAREDDGRLDADLSDGPRLRARRVYNCTYSGINQIEGIPRTRQALKHEIAELALVRVPRALSGIGVTVMDGPYFSLMPFPAEGVHTLSHVRYTPHEGWVEDDQPERCPEAELRAREPGTTFPFMMRDARRYVPAIGEVTQVGSLMEVKTVLARNEVDDGRPILCEESPELPGVFSVLGAKVDNVYDVLEYIESRIPALELE